MQYRMCPFTDLMCRFECTGWILCSILGTGTDVKYLEGEDGLASV